MASKHRCGGVLERMPVGLTVWVDAVTLTWATVPGYLCQRCGEALVGHDVLAARAPR